MLHVQIKKIVCKNLMQLNKNTGKLTKKENITKKTKKLKTPKMQKKKNMYFINDIVVTRFKYCA